MALWRKQVKINARNQSINRSSQNLPLPRKNRWILWNESEKWSGSMWTDSVCQPHEIKQRIAKLSSCQFTSDFIEWSKCLMKSTNCLLITWIYRNFQLTMNQIRPLFFLNFILYLFKLQYCMQCISSLFTWDWIEFFVGILQKRMLKHIKLKRHYRRDW